MSPQDGPPLTSIAFGADSRSLTRAQGPPQREFAFSVAGLDFRGSGSMDRLFARLMSFRNVEHARPDIRKALVECGKGML